MTTGGGSGQTTTTKSAGTTTHTVVVHQPGDFVPTCEDNGLSSPESVGTWIEIIVSDSSGKPIKGESYDLYLVDGSIVHGKTNDEGRIFESGIPEGKWFIDIPNYPSAMLVSVEDDNEE